MIPVVFLIRINQKPSSVSATWWNNSWTYRSSISIGHSGSPQSNVQIKILNNYNLSTEVGAGKIQSNLNDLRFVDINGELISYWIEDATESSVDIWGIIPSLPTGNSIIYMYYGNPSAVSASSTSNITIGGTMTYADGYRLHTFKSSDTLANTNNTNVEILVVAGGGGGAAMTGGGGGAGGLIYNSSFAVTNQNYSVSVGLGGSGQVGTANPGNGADGQSSIFGSLIAIGGGGAGTNSGVGRSGGSGGGAGHNNTPGGLGTSGQGNNGSGGVTSAPNYGAGGGGGAGAVGGTPTNYAGGNGGVGLAYSISGSSQYYAGGGGGGTYMGGTYGLGGSGGGGNAPAGNATPNTGGGGGGQINNLANAGNGGSGIVILRYSSAITNSPNIEENRPQGINIGGTSIQTPPGNLVAYYNFDEGYGSIANNSGSIGSSANGTLATGTSSPTWVNSGKIGKALSFDGNNDIVTANNSVNLNLSSAITTTFWINDNSTPTVGGGTTASSGSLSPGTMTDDATVGSVVWTTPDNGKVSDNVYATASSGFASQTSHYLKATNFGFSIPTGATINGILVEFERKENFEDLSYVRDSGIKIVKADGTIGTTNKADTVTHWPTTDTYKSYGSSSDLWGETWTAENINDVDFGAVLSAYLKSGVGSQGNPGEAYVDHIRITVYYTVPTAAAQVYVGKGRDAYQIETTGNGNIIGYLNTGSTVATTITQNSWHHVAMTYDGSNQKLYVDGVLKNAVALTGAIGTNTNNLTIGSKITGQIDEIKIYNYALTADEIKKDYNQGSSVVFGVNNLTVGSTSTSALYCVPGSTDPCAPPIIEWNFEESVGTSAFDTSASTNHGSITGTSWSTGKIGKALQFNSSNNSYLISSSDPGTMSSGTYSLWVKPSTINATMGWIGSNFDIFQWTGNLLYFRAGNQSSVSISNWIPGTWHYLTLRWNGSNYYGYIDGNEVTTGIQSGSRSGAINLGRFDNNYYFDGSVDQVRIYNYARTPAQIAWDYNQGAPIGWWKFDECTGTNIKDWSFNGNTGIATIGAGGSQTSVGTCTTPNTAWGIGATGKFNSSLSFDGTDDVVNMSSATNLPYGSSPRTVTFWIKPTSQNKAVFSYGSRSFDQLFTIMLSDGYFGVHYYGNSLTNTFPNSRYTVGQWQHVTIAYTGQNIITYLNGIQKDNLTKTIDTRDSGSFVIGSDTTGAYSYPYFSGQIDDVRIYNYALTSNQIKQIYNGGAINFGKLD